jgi:predicted nucleic acid-binding protein
VQVVSETYVTLTRKIKPAFAADAAWSFVQTLFAWAPQPLDETVLRQAQDMQRKHGLSWWDSLIVSAAHAQNCRMLLSEDLQDQAIYGRITVRNPFKLGVSDIPATYGGGLPASHPHRARGRPKRLVR